MEPSPQICELCGKPSIVHVSLERSTGETIMRHLCGECADRHPFEDVDQDDAWPRMRRSAADLMIVLGAVFAMMALAADHLHVNSNNGFGWLQFTGVIVGTCLTLIGAIFRVDLMAVAGAALFLVSCTADWLGIGVGRVPGDRQRIALLVAAILIIVGLFMRYRPHKRDASDNPPS